MLTKVFDKMDEYGLSYKSITSWQQVYIDYYLSDTLRIDSDKVMYSRWCSWVGTKCLVTDQYYQCDTINKITIKPNLIIVEVYYIRGGTAFLRFQNTKENMDQIKKVANFLIPLDK